MSFLIQAALEGKRYTKLIPSFSFICLALTLLLTDITVQAQVTFTSFPANQQLYQRNESTNRAVIPIQGYFTQNGYAVAKVKVYKENLRYDEQSINLSYRNRSQASFSLSLNLPAELTNFKVEFYGVKNGVEQLLRTATKVVVGDVILINGQSNAEAGAAAKPQDFDEFARSYNNGWTNLQYSYPGQWGGRLAKNIIQQQRIPVAIFNQAVGGKDIQFYLPSSDSNSNYSKLNQRLNAAGISEVSSIVWFQGEGDGWTTPIDTYKSKFRTLHQAWVNDYRPIFTYIFQIRFLSCGHNKPYPFEAQRQLAVELPSVGIMSSTNVLHDGCHFPYVGGYQDMADNLFQLMRRDIYGYNLSNVEAPNISSATQVSNSELLLTFNNTSRLYAVGSPWRDFKVEGSAATVTSGSVAGNQVRLFLSGQTSGITGVSYLAHSGSANDWIVNSNDIGSLTFYNFPIQRSTNTTSQELPTTPQYEAPVPTNNVNCNNLQVITQEDDLYIYGLEGPNVTYDVYTDQWEVISRCLQNCTEGPKVFQDLPAGRYWVRATIFSENWEELCKLEDYYTIQSSTSVESCNDIGIHSINGGVYVTGLNNAPISSVIIMATDWSRQYYNCWDDACGTSNNISIALGNGQYRVNVKYYSTSYALLCEKEQIVEVRSSFQNEISNSRSTRIQDNTTFNVFPTITSNNLNITWNNSDFSVTKLEIISPQGGVIRQIPIAGINQQIEINVGTLPKGIYFLNAPLKDGSNLTRKFIIQ